MNDKILYDDIDKKMVLEQKWYITTKKRNGANYARYVVNGKGLLMHRLIMGLDFGDKRVVDHINHNGLDNRRTNLRVTTRSQNGANRNVGKKSTTGFKGIYWDKNRKKWKASLTKDGKTHFIGRYKNPREAAKAYDSFARKMHGEYALLNFPNK